MRLSDAIATGRVLVEHKGGNIAGCAIGMALASGGGADYMFQGLGDMWHWTIQAVVDRPCGNCGGFFNNDDGMMVMHGAGFSGALAHMFDVHVMQEKDWTLDQLIDWVRSVEPNEPTIEETATEFVEASAEVLEWAT